MHSPHHRESRGVCDWQIFNVCEIYARKYLKPGEVVLSEIISVSSDEFYGEGYDDSDRRIPEITKARTLLGWEPTWKLPDLIEVSMDYQVADFQIERQVGDQ